MIEIGRRIEILRERLLRGGDRFFRFGRRMLCKNGLGSDAEESQADLRIQAMRRKPHAGIVALSPGKLVKGTLASCGKLGSDQNFVRLEVGLEQTLEEIRRLRAPLALLSLNHQCRIERERARRVLGRRVGERQAAAERAAVP